MTLLERHLRSVLQAGLAPTQVWLRVADASRVEIPRDLAQRLPIRFSPPHRTPAQALAEALRAGPPVVALAGDTVVDARLLAHLASRPGSWAARCASGDAATTVLRVESELPEAAEGAERLEGLAEAWIAAGAVKELPLDEVPAYLPKLRRALPVYGFRILDAASRDRAERFLFWSNYKGSTDFFTKYVYPPLVWRAVRPLARWRVHPNWISLWNVVITLAAVPLFAAALWVPGLILAYTMSVLDSVDGKLARLTFRSSRLGHVLDHGLDVVHPPLWYAAWAWPLGGGDVASPVFQASLWMAALYFLDRIVTQCFTWTTARSIHAWAPLDVRMRTFISRRNINLPLFTLGLIAGVPLAAFAVIVAWQAATLVFHAVRLAQAWRAERTSGSRAAAPEGSGPAPRARSPLGRP